MNRRRPSGFSALSSGLRAALQWRLLLWWILSLGLATLLFAAPIWLGLQAQFAHSVHAADIAAGRSVPLLIEGFAKASESTRPANGAVAALALALLLSPWLTGMVVASLRAGRGLGLGELAHGGLREYWRMLRLLSWSLLPLGVAAALGAAALAFAGKQADAAILASEVDRGRNLAIAVLAVLFVVAHATVEAARGWLGADPALRSIFRAWWRGTKLVFSRPLATLVVYLGCTLAGYALAAVFGYLRLRTDGAGIGSFLVGLALTQLVVAALAWSRIARLYGLAALARERIAQAAAVPPPRTGTDAAGVAAEQAGSVAEGADSALIRRFAPPSPASGRRDFMGHFSASPR